MYVNRIGQHFTFSSLSAKTLCILILFFLFLIPGCRTGEKWHTSTFLFFDTVCEIKIFCSETASKSAEQEIKRVFSEIEGHFSPGIRDYASQSVLELFQRALNVYQNSSGCFDITVAPLSKAWGFFNGSLHVPPSNEIKALLKHIGMDKIKEENGSLVLLPGMELDWGGIAKGCGIDLASKSLIAMGIMKGFINAGGDLFCWGQNPDNQPWKIGVKHPRKRGFLCVLAVSGLGTATTGDYQRYFIEKGTRYHHVFNPSTGYPAKGKQSVTVIGPETLLCDALSTALFVSNKPEMIIEKYPEYGALLIDSNGRTSVIGKPYPFQPLK